MADLASATNGLITLALRSRPSILVHRFIENIRSAPTDMRTLTCELQELGPVLESLRKSLAVWKSLGLEEVFDECMDTFLKLGLLVQSYGIRAGDGRLARWWKIWKWAWREGELAALRKRLEGQKGMLGGVALTRVGTVSGGDAAK